MDLLKSTDCLQPMDQQDLDPPAQLVDKAVSTEDLRFATRNVNLDVARLEAVLHTLVENKVEAMKNDKKPTSSSAPMVWDKRMRITSTSTASSSHKDVKEQRQHCHKKRIRSDDYEQVRRKDGLVRHNDRHDRVPSPSPPRSPRCHHPVSPSRVVREAQICCHEEQTQSDDDDDDYEDYVHYPQLHPADRCIGTCHGHCGCHRDNHNGQIKSMQYDDDYVSINMEDFENVEEDAIITRDELRRARRKRHRRRRKKRKRGRHHQQALVLPSVEKVKIVDSDDLPQRARWTIVATACLLLLMCLLLVGVTLRMAPIIDDMVRRENEELLNSLQSGYNSTSNHAGARDPP